MLERYLKKINSILNSFHMDEHDKKTYLNAIKQAINTEKKTTDDEAIILSNLKDPRIIVEELSMSYRRKTRIPFINIILKLIPWLLLGLYLLVGFTANLWHPTWLMFLLWPLLVVLLESINDYDIHPISSVSPMLILFLFLALGIIFNLWHPAWALLFLIPMFPLVNSRHSFTNKSVFYSLLMPLLILPLFVFLHYYLQTIHPIWILWLLLLLPVFIHGTSTPKIILGLGLFALGLMGYIIGYSFFNQEASLYFITLLFLAFIIAQPKRDSLGFLYRPTMISLCLIGLLAFFTFTLYLEGFSWAWVTVLIPLFYYHLIQGNFKRRPISLSTFFIAVACFALFGGYYGHFHFAWLVFLFIPIAKIVEAKYVT